MRRPKREQDCFIRVNPNDQHHKERHEYNHGFEPDSHEMLKIIEDSRQPVAFLSNTWVSMLTRTGLLWGSAHPDNLEKAIHEWCSFNSIKFFGIEGRWMGPDRTEITVMSERVYDYLKIITELDRSKRECFRHYSDLVDVSSRFDKYKSQIQFKIEWCSVMIFSILFSTYIVYALIKTI